MKRIAIHIGAELPPNIVRLLGGLDKLAADHFNFVIIGTNLDMSQLPPGYEYQDVPIKTRERGISKMFATYRRVDSYLCDPTTTSDAIWQLTAPHFHAVPILLAARRHSLPVATRVPGNKFDEFHEQKGLNAAKLFALNNIGLRALRYATMIVTLSQHNRQNIIERGIPARKIRVLRPPLDTEQFTAVDTERQQELQTKLEFDSSAYNLLYVGRLSELKGIGDLEAIVADYEGDATYEFHFVGNGPFASRIEQYNNTTYHGFVDPHQLHQYYKAADMLIHPSYIEEEGISWTMLEAAATGLPVVARDIENAAELASFVFSEKHELYTYLSNPTQWTAATYPTEWSLDTLSPAYNDFFDTLTAKKEN